MKIEVVNIYGDNWFENVDFPESIRVYKMPYPLSDKQNKYVAITEYSEELYEMCCDIHCAVVDKVNDLMVISITNGSIGCNITEFSNLSDNYSELGEKYESYLKTLSIKKFEKNKHAFDNVDVDKYFELMKQDNVSEDVLKSELDELMKNAEPSNLLHSIYKVLSYNGDDVKYAKMVLTDFNRKPCWCVDVSTCSIDDLFSGTLYPDEECDNFCRDSWTEIGTVDEFNNFFEDFLIEIQFK